ncbi:MAG: trypsin-like peptidase domain-containing protein [Clostridiales bacterium]|nr:trypsin-like peptidase domain-containing protein [Clostridiales bacterium]
MLTTVLRLWYNTDMDEQEKINQDKTNEDNSNVPAPIADAPPSDELMLVPDGELPTDKAEERVPAESASITMYEAEQSDNTMHGGYASVKGSPVERRDNRLVWIVIIVMTVMCIAVGICSAVVTARLVQKGIKPAEINTNGVVQQNVSAVVTARKSSIVEVRCGSLTSSGIAMKRDGKKAIVLTNAHAIAQYVSNTMTTPRVRFYGYDDYFAEVDVVGYDEHYDIAVLSVAVDDELAVFDIDGSDVLSPDAEFIEGDYVVSIGNAMSMGIAAYDGIISRKSELLECDELFGANRKKIVPVFRTTAVINAGMSGGGVFDMNGRLIGLGTYRMSNTAGVDTEGGASTDVENTGFATPMSIVYPVYKRILAGDGGAVGLFTVNLGKTTSAVGRMDMPMLDINCEYEGFKLTVKSVSDPASKIKTGDIITKIGDYEVTQKIDGYNDASDVCGVTGQFLRYHRQGSGKPLTLTIMRGDATLTVTFDNLRYAI